MNRSALIIPILTGAVLAPVAPAVAVAAPAPVSQSAARQHAQVDAEQALAQVNARIAELHKMPQAQVPASEAPKVNYGEEIRKLLDTAFELRTAIESIIAGKVPPVDLSTIPARVDLLTTSVKTIQQANHNLVNKVEAAHVELGFSITRALIRTINPTSTAAQLAESKTDVLSTYAKVAAYRDLKPTDAATVYVKNRLNTKIWQTRINRDKYLLGKNAEGYKAINKALTHATGVWFNPATTVKQVDDEVKALDLAFQATLDRGPADGKLRTN